MRRLVCTLGIVALAACGTEEPIVQPVGVTRPALNRQNSPMRYTVTVLPSLGGTSRGNALNASGLVAGYSNLSDGSRHAALWNDGVTDLGTLGGPNSSVPWPGLNNRGTIVGI